MKALRATSQQRKRCLLVVAAFVFTVGLGNAQTSQFLFDLNGNLTTTMAETSLPPQIIGQPQNQVKAANQSATFSVVVADPRQLTYQWQFNGVNLSAATNATLLLEKVNPDHEGAYRAILTNPFGTVASTPARLWIDDDADGIGDSWELAYFGTLADFATADADGDGVSNLREFLDDSNPTNSISARYRLLVIRDGGAVLKTPERASYTNGESVTLRAVASANEAFHAWLGDIVTRDNPVTLVMTNDKTIYARFTPIVFTWTNSTSSDWEIATNWTPNLVPGRNDTAVITRSGAFNVALNTTAICADVTLGGVNSSPTLTGLGTLQVGGSLTWFSGTMSGGGLTIVDNGGTLNLNQPSVVVLNNRTLENGGKAQWTDSGSISMNFGAVITNRPGAIFHIEGSGALVAPGGSSRVENSGTFKKSGNTNTFTIPAAISFNNSGLVEIENGNLNLTGGGTNSGSFSTEKTSVTEWTGGTFALNPGSQLIGDGRYRLNFGTLIGHADVVFDRLDLLNGTLTGPGVLVIRDVMNWANGTMSGSGRTIIAPGAMLNANLPGVAILSARTLEIRGTAVYSGAGILGIIGGAVVTNCVGALFQIDNENSSGLGGASAGGRFENAGIFRKASGTGTTILSAGLSFSNYGIVDIRSGRLLANGPYGSSSNAILNCVLNDTTLGTAYGQLRVQGAVTLSGTLSVEFANGFSPALHDLFTVVSAGTRNGTFTQFLYPANAVGLEMSNSPNAVILRVTSDNVHISTPTLLPPQFVGSNAILSWTAVTNVTYQLEYNSDLVSTNWNLVPGDVTIISNRASKLDTITSSNRFYRVRELP